MCLSHSKEPQHLTAEGSDHYPFRTLERVRLNTFSMIYWFNKSSVIISRPAYHPKAPQSRPQRTLAVAVALVSSECWAAAGFWRRRGCWLEHLQNEIGGDKKKKKKKNIGAEIMYGAGGRDTVEKDIDRLRDWWEKKWMVGTDKKGKEKRLVWCSNETSRTTSCHSHCGKMTKQQTARSSTVTWRSGVIVFQSGYALESLKHLAYKIIQKMRSSLACCLATKMSSLH